MSEQPNDIGAIFKTERERQGLTLDMVHEATKVPIDSLKAIEEGYKVRTLTAFYYKSFVRIYAQHLNIDPQPLLAQISSEPPKKKFEPRPQEPVSKKVQEMRSLNLFARPLRSQHSKKILKVVGILVVAALLVLLLTFVVRKVMARVASAPKVAKTTKPPKTVRPSAQDEAKKLELKRSEEKKKIDQPRSSEAVKAAEPVKKSEPVKAIEPVKTAAVETKAAPKPAADETKPVPKADQNTIAAKAVKNVSVSLRAQNNSWLNVRADGKTVFIGVFKKGSSESWTASKLIEISGKDIDQLEFEVNGKSIGRLSRYGAAVKKVRVTPEGLTVDK